MKFKFLIISEKEKKKRTSSYTLILSIILDSRLFTSDMTPIILAAHKNNYECIKLLLDKKATILHPHDIRCLCKECAKAEDSLCFSRSRINTYQALTSPSLICLSSKDPILYAFELSYELRRLSNVENEFRNEYQVIFRLVLKNFFGEHFALFLPIFFLKY
ncbi:unnamed protein product [Brugia pahangi]|uniref:TRP_2 domain-containing protein n=1 Tax=Brugia pahangi TaxID=6280 RepID=A0A0N4TFI8_BRUPA|nr:unnamed protein product [Brugia pahangi]